MPTILRSLHRLLSLFEDKNIPHMIIGGYALPFYGRIRTTIDIDLAVMIKTETELQQFYNWLQTIDFKATISHPENPLVVVMDQKEKVEMKLWLKPDGISFDNETLRRRRKVNLNKNIQAWIISPEDFVVNKLARPDRGAIDEQDVKSVLVRQEGKLDKEYLEKRAQEAEVLTVLETIQAS